MDAKQIAGAILSTIIRICVGIAVIYFVYNIGIESYNFGYRVFADLPMDVKPGIDKEVTIVTGKTPLEIGEILEDKGVIMDKKIFFVQELLSESHGKLKPGAYTLNTSMTGTEIIAVLSGQSQTEEDAEELESEKTPTPTADGDVEIQDNAGGEDHTSEMAPDEEPEETSESEGE